MRSRIPEYYINQDMESFNDYCSDFQQVSILFGVPIAPGALLDQNGLEMLDENSLPLET